MNQILASGHDRARSAAIVVAVALAAVATGCAIPSPSNAPPTASAVATADASPTGAPSPSPAPTPTPAPTCAKVDYVTFVASDRLTDIALARGSGGDLLGFTLDPSPGSIIRPQLRITAVEPPFTQGGSGLPFDVAGEHHLQVTFEGMAHVDPAGNIVYVGPNDLPGIGGPVAQVVLGEAFESYVTFIVGYDGDGCVALQVTPTRVTIAIEAR